LPSPGLRCKLPSQSPEARQIRRYEMASHGSGALCLTWAVAALVMAVSGSEAQENTRKSVALRVPHTTVPVRFDCSSNSSARWEKVPRIAVSRESAVLVRVDDPNALVTAVPNAIEGKLDSFHAEYRFQWDEDRLYGYVEIKERDLDSQHPETSEKTFRRSPNAAAFDDMFHSTVIVEVGAPSWRRWITEMHVRVRPPNAKPMTSMFFGRTNDEEEFRELSGEAVACLTDGGWIAKFAVAWLPFGDWQPKPGVTADLRLIAPLPHSREGYVLVSVVPFLLTQ